MTHLLKKNNQTKTNSRNFTNFDQTNEPNCDPYFFDPKVIITDCLANCKHNGFQWMCSSWVIVAENVETPKKTSRGGGLSTSAFVNPAAAYAYLPSELSCVFSRDSQSSTASNKLRK